MVGIQSVQYSLYHRRYYLWEELKRKLVTKLIVQDTV